MGSPEYVLCIVDFNFEDGPLVAIDIIDISVLRNSGSQLPPIEALFLLMKSVFNNTFLVFIIVTFRRYILVIVGDNT